MKAINLSRRQFLKNSGIVGGGLVIGFSLTGCSSSQLPINTIEGGYVPNAFLQITSTNDIHFYCPRDEMGQGVMTGLSTLIGEELGVNPSEFILEFAGVHSDYNNPGMGVQATGGSNAMNAHYTQLRQVGADLRQLLLNAAVKDLGISSETMTTNESHIIVEGEKHPFSRFIATAATLSLPADTQLKSPADFKYIGKDAIRVDGLAKATGTAEYGIDADFPGMHYAVVKRSPVAGAKLRRVDKTAANQMPGVTDIIEISSGVAIVAQKYWQARQAADAISPEWETVPLAAFDTARIKSDYSSALASEDGLSAQEEGDFAGAINAAAETLESEFWAPFLAHAPLEPMNAVLKIENGEADLWSGTQGPAGAQGLVARFSGIETENIRVHSSYLGGGFGRRGTLTHIIEVTEIAVATNKPIKLTWTREDDIRHGFYRPASLMKIKAGRDESGNITAWQANRAGGNITPETLKNMLPALLPGIGDGPLDFLTDLAADVFTGVIPDPSSIEGLAEDYDLPNREVNHFTVEHGLPLTFWRSVGHSQNAFAKESMMDELAEKAGIDPVAFRLQNTRNNPRLHNVIRVAGERMKAMKPAQGRHLGFAAHGSFGTDVAEIAEISVENGRIKVHKVTCVVDCGIAVTPDVVRAQMEGSVLFGLTAALYGKLDIENGEIVQSNFNDYPILRMNETPVIDVVIIESGDNPTGVGEPGVPPIAPAVASAVYAATGNRLRHLPLRLS